MTSNRTSNGSGVLLLDGLDGYVDDDVGSVVPHWVLKTYLTIIIVGGVFGNLILIYTIVRSSARWRKDAHYRGLMVFLVHLAVTDIGILTLVAPVEVWVMKTPEGLWEFSAEYCNVFMGLEAVMSLMTVYLLVALSLHAVVTKSAPLPDDGKCRPMSSLAVPLCLVWLIAVSLSIPEFCFSETVFPRPDYQLCTILDNSNERRSVFHIVVAFFRVAVPVIVLLATSVMSAIRLCGSCDETESPSSKRHVLRISLVLTASYATMSLQRSIFAVVYSFLPKNVTVGPDAFREPPLANVATSPTASLVISMVHFLLSALRPVLCFIGSRHIQSTLALCCCCCCRPTTGSNRPR